MIYTLWFVFILAETFRNYYIIEVKKLRPDYFQSFVIRSMFAILHCSLVIEEQEYWHFTTFEIIQYIIPFFIFYLTSFFWFFTFMLNIARKKPWFYRGKNSGFLSRLSDNIYYPLYGISFIYTVLFLWLR